VHEAPDLRAPQVLDQVAAVALERRPQDQDRADALEQLAPKRRVAVHRLPVGQVEVGAVDAVARVHAREEAPAAAPGHDSPELVLAEDAALVAPPHEVVDRLDREIVAPAQGRPAEGLAGAHGEAGPEKGERGGDGRQPADAPQPERAARRGPAQTREEGQGGERHQVDEAGVAEVEQERAEGEGAVGGRQRAPLAREAQRRQGDPGQAGQEGVGLAEARVR
jgi:hypothetical protein